MIFFQVELNYIALLIDQYQDWGAWVESPCEVQGGTNKAGGLSESIYARSFPPPLLYDSPHARESCHP